ncbi:MAG: 16S rRNA (guanine(527)-N(7))-methyltransferase RsmG [Planctomycetota bacterium]|nr:16S rRNA (guanine(527)-N(7))-methyltransferase RsmG [Planctomycetota bacterium]
MLEDRLAATERPETPTHELITWELFRDRFISALGPFAPGFSRETLARHAWLVREKNQVMNLTRIVTPEEMAIRHTADSLAALPLLAEGGEQIFQHLLDLGTGAGWPGLSIAIACPHLRVTLIDSTRKKIDFLQSVVDELGLQDRVTCVWARFEDWSREHRKEIDLVTARAVGPIDRILGWCTNNYFGPILLWKGPAADQELKDVEGLMWKRRLFVALDEPYQIPGDEAVRRLILIDHQRS